MLRVLSLGGAGEGIGPEGAATVARALESGRCGLTSLDLDREWGAPVLSVSYHRAALQCAALYRHAGYLYKYCCTFLRRQCQSKL